MLCSFHTQRAEASGAHRYCTHITRSLRQDLAHVFFQRCLDAKARRRHGFGIELQAHFVGVVRSDVSRRSMYWAKCMESPDRRDVTQTRHKTQTGLLHCLSCAFACLLTLSSLCMPIFSGFSAINGPTTARSSRWTCVGLDGLCQDRFLLPSRLRSGVA